jgi:hypothetical protein
MMRAFSMPNLLCSGGMIALNIRLRVVAEIDCELPPPH